MAERLRQVLRIKFTGGQGRCWELLEQWMWK